MVKLSKEITFEIEPIPPYSFELTIRKPAGWPLFTPLEIYDKGIIWTAAHIHGLLTGIKLESRGTTEQPKMAAALFLKNVPKQELLEGIMRCLIHDLAADEDLAEFYELARRDCILRHAVVDLYGMHSTSPSTIFPDAALAILLQMTTLKRSNEMMNCLIRRYGEVADFDGKKIPVWPLPKRIAKIEAPDLAKACNLGYRAKHLANLARKLTSEEFPGMEELERLEPEEAKRRLLELPGIGDYSADIINPHGGFPIDAWSADVFGRLFFGEEPKDRRKAIEGIKREGLRRWGKWSWMAFLYVVQDLENLLMKLGMELRLE